MNSFFFRSRFCARKLLIVLLAFFAIVFFPAVSLAQSNNFPDPVDDFTQEIQNIQSSQQNPTPTDQPSSFGGGVQGLSSFGGIFAGSNPSENNENALSNFELIISRALGGLTTLATIFFIIYFVIGTFGWITAGGDSSKINKSRDEMIQGALGMVVVVISYVLIGLIGRVVGLDVLNPAEQIRSVFQITN